MTGRVPLQPEEFLKRFFGDRYEACMTPGTKLASMLADWVKRVQDQDDRILLPRLGDPTVWYALARNPRDARAFREELLAAVGPSYSDFEGVPATLDRDDPVDAAVLRFTGPHAFKLTLVAPDLKEPCRKALRRMLELHDGRPGGVSGRPRSPGVLLRDLELALQHLDRDSADALLAELRASGHLDAQNLLFLDIRLWEVFEEWGRLREVLEQETILDLHRPRRVTQALLRALYRWKLVDFERGGRTQEALACFRTEVYPRFKALLDSRTAMPAAEVAKLFMLKAAEEQDPTTREGILAGANLKATEMVYLRALADLVRAPEQPLQPAEDEAWGAYRRGDLDRTFALLASGGGGEERLTLILYCARDLNTLAAAELALHELLHLSQEQRTRLDNTPHLLRLQRDIEERYTSPSGDDSGVGSLAVPDGWLAWMQRVNAGSLSDNDAAAIAEQGASEWDPDDLARRPGDVAELAGLMQDPSGGALAQVQRALPHLQRFLLGDERPRTPFKPLLRALFTRYAFDDAQGLLTRQAASEVLAALLRLGVEPQAMTELVEELGLLFAQGVPWEQVDWALDLLETLITLAPGASAQNTRVAVLVQTSLHTWTERLRPTQILLFNQLCRECGADTAIPLPTVDEASDLDFADFLKGKTVAIYSLEEAAMARVKLALEEVTDRVRVLLFHDKVGGSPALKSAARDADVFLIVTGAAKHAATGFIEDNRPKESLTVHSRAKGSSSMMRALEQVANSASEDHPDGHIRR
ncbi:MAG: hypothetical protein H6739_06585 [Alphaproteobacteria bacterium]|nr:hypothetical protein [Alphaproteobacteria bacterium]